MRIHLGHHFYGAGNLGDDFMLAGFLHAMRSLAPDASYTCCVPFAREPLAARFPEITWLRCEPEVRQRAVAACDVWLGLGGSPFQHALSRWFIDHLMGELEFCTRAAKPMYFLGIGLQSAADLGSREVRDICARADGIWTRDPVSAELLTSVPVPCPVKAANDFAHVFFRETSPSPAAENRITVVANFDYGNWPGLDGCLDAAEAIASDRVWLAQESRELPGAERMLYAGLAASRRSRWRLVSPEIASAPIAAVLERWPSGEWLVTSRFHAALAGSWAGSRVVVIATNEKLRAAAREIGCPSIAPGADTPAVTAALSAAQPARVPTAAADAALAACGEFVGQARSRLRVR